MLQFIPVEKAEASVNDKDVPSVQADFYNWSSLVSHVLAPFLVLYMLKWAGKRLGQPPCGHLRIWLQSCYLYVDRLSAGHGLDDDAVE